MKTKITVEQEVEISFVEIILPVWYEDEDIPNDFPLRDGEVWAAKVEIDTGKILNWPEGVAGNMYMKVTDGGIYRLLDQSGAVILGIENDYVPNNLIPGEWGDYVNLEIDEAGIITNWPKSPNLSDFQNRR